MQRTIYRQLIKFDAQAEVLRLHRKRLIIQLVMRTGCHSDAISVGHPPCRSDVIDMAMSEQHLLHLELVVFDKLNDDFPLMVLHHSRIDDDGLSCVLIPGNECVFAERVDCEFGNFHFLKG